MSEHPFNWLEMAGVPEMYNHVVMSAIVAVVLVVTTVVARGQLVRTMGLAEGALVPEKNWTFKNFFEIVAESLFKLTESVIGHHDAPTYFPLIGTLFVFIFTSNLLGLIPGIMPPTENMNTTLAFGLFVFVYYNYAGLKAHGFSYVKQFIGPLWWLAWLIFPIEVVSHVFRPISLALRLRGNIMGDHIVLSVFSGLVPYLLPVVFYGLGVFVAFIQAFVFCLMTMVYISLSISHDH
jgi:F-type H+-transporting ATPase subunit a